jgi:uncharacterized protein YecA (UPF0149 family)
VVTNHNALLEERVMAKIGRNDPCPCGSGKKLTGCEFRTLAYAIVVFGET